MKHYNYYYDVDWEKVETLADLKRLLKATDFTFVGFGENHPQLEPIKDLLVRVERKAG